jgi:hypothetical protein
MPPGFHFFGFRKVIYFTAGLELWEYGCRDPSRRPRNTLYTQKLAPTSLTRGVGALVGIVRSRTKAMELLLLLLLINFTHSGCQPCRPYVAQAFSRRLPTATARVLAQVRLSEICGEQSGTGHVPSEYLGFPCQAFHRLLHTLHHPSSDAGTISQILVDVPSGFSLTPPQETQKKGHKPWESPPPPWKTRPMLLWPPVKR